MRLKKQHELGLDEAKKRIDDVSVRLKNRFSVDAEWHGDDLRFSGNGISGHIAVADRSVLIDLRLGFAMMLFENQIRSALEDAMDEHLT